MATPCSPISELYARSSASWVKSNSVVNSTTWPSRCADDSDRTSELRKERKKLSKTWALQHACYVCEIVISVVRPVRNAGGTLRRLAATGEEDGTLSWRGCLFKWSGEWSGCTCCTAAASAYLGTLMRQKDRVLEQEATQEEIIIPNWQVINETEARKNNGRHIVTRDEQFCAHKERAISF